MSRSTLSAPSGAPKAAAAGPVARVRTLVAENPTLVLVGVLAILILVMGAKTGLTRGATVRQ